MHFPWEDSTRAYADAAGWFVATTALVGDRWEATGLGDWDVRALVGHTSRSFVTVEEYLARPAASIEVETAVDYYRAITDRTSGEAVARRGHDAGTALGPDPASAVAGLAERALRLVEGCDGTEPVTTIAGGMRLGDYLPTRTFELGVHTCDLASALGAPLDVPPTVAEQTLALTGALAVRTGQAGRLLLAATGRQVAAPFSVL